MKSKMVSDASAHGFSNRLRHEKSPYLLQHAHNPVDWYPWGEDALQRAIDEDRPILLSIGYSTCHWCHVMEGESFEDETVADFMNRHFVCIKVDREERPDLDQIYMTAVTSMTGSGGWPLNVFLTPGRRPFFGGTYFPPRSTVGLSSWRRVLAAVADAWENPGLRRKIETAADDVCRVLQRVLENDSGEQAVDPGLPEKAVKGYASVFDEKQGGFSGAPKFPSPAIQSFLLRYSRTPANDSGADRALADRAREMALETLRCMARGGIYDQIGGGFHRYATDDRWFVPHFEKMLYDNAQLIVNYSAAHQNGGGEFFLSIARETADYLLRDMQHPDGGFYSAEDADSLPPEDDSAGNGHKVEGAFYTWTEDSVRFVLKDRLAANLFCHRYGIVPAGNVDVDPHGYFRGKNILYRARSIKESAARFEMTTQQAEDLLFAAKEKLLAFRNRRPRPHLDDKILTDWNGLAVSAMATIYRATGAKKYLDAGVRAARFLQERLYETTSGHLFRRWRAGERSIGALASDWAFFIQGLMDLHEADKDSDWLTWAVKLTEQQMKWFYDSDRGRFYMTRLDHDPYLLFRPVEGGDSVIPSAASVSVLNLQRLSVMTGSSTYFQVAERIIRGMTGKMAQYPMGSPLMLTAVMRTRRASGESVFELERSGHL